MPSGSSARAPGPSAAESTPSGPRGTDGPRHRCETRTCDGRPLVADAEEVAGRRVQRHARDAAEPRCLEPVSGRYRVDDELAEKFERRPETAAGRGAGGGCGRAGRDAPGRPRHQGGPRMARDSIGRTLIRVPDVNELESRGRLSALGRRGAFWSILIHSGGSDGIANWRRGSGFRGRDHRRAASVSTTGSATRGRCCSRTRRTSRRCARPSSGTWPSSSRSSTSGTSRSSASASTRSTTTSAGPTTSRRRRDTRRTTR